MAKIFNGKILFANAIQPTGAQPLDDRVVVQSYSDLVDAATFGDAKYLGMIVGVVDDSKLYMLTNTDVTAEGAWKEIGAGGAVAVDTYADAVALATSENIGQVIYVKTKSSYDADGEGEGAAVEYDAAPYIVIGAGSLQKLAASTASGDIEGDVAELTTKVTDLETVVGKAAVGDASATGLVADVAELDASVSDHEQKISGLNTTISELGNTYVAKEEGKGLSTNDYTTEEKNKLAGIEDGAEVNVIEKVKVNGEELSVTDKAVNIEIPAAAFQSVAADDKLLTLAEGGVLSSSISYAREDVEGVDSLVLKGKNGAVIGSVPVADFVADGMLESVTEVENTNKFKFTFKKVDGSTEDFEVDFSKYVDTYHADDTTLELDSTTNTFKVKDNVFDTYGSASAVQDDLDSYKTTNNEAVANKVEQSAYDEKVEALENAIAAKADAATLNSYATISSVDGSLALKADDAVVVKGVSLNGVDGTFADNKVALTVDLSGYAEKSSVDSSLALKADKDDFDALVEKVGHEATADASATGLVADIASLRADLSNKASSTALTEGLATKLDKTATVNGVQFNESGAAVIDAADIKLNGVIGKKEVDGSQVDRYTTDNDIQYVLNDIDTRIDAINTTIDNVAGGVIADITAGDGINVDKTTKINPTVSVKVDELSVKIDSNAKIAVKVSAKADNVLTVDGNNGLYVAKSVPTWEAIE